MKKTTLFFCIFSLFISCKKSDDDDPSSGVNPALLEKYPQEWIFTIDESAARYTYIARI